MLPSSAGAEGRFAAIAVKLNGVIASTKPSSGRYSIRFHVPGPDAGWSASSFRANDTLNRQKSMSSQAASISAWKTDLDWPRIVAAFIAARHGPASRSAAFRKMAARSSNDSARQAGAASRAAATAAATSSSVASPIRPSTRLKLCGCTTSICSPPPIRRSPPTYMVSGVASPASSLIFRSTAARSGLPGAYCLTGSFAGTGTLVTASMTDRSRCWSKHRRRTGVAPAAPGSRRTAGVASQPLMGESCHVRQTANYGRAPADRLVAARERKPFATPAAA